MKLIIDIPNETYNYVKQNYRYGIGTEVACNLGFAVAKGTPLPKGYWENYCYQNNRCSICGYIIADSDTDEYKYCPNCGAEMGEVV